MFTFYLHDVVISSKLQVTKFIEKLKIPFFVVFLLLIILTIFVIVTVLLDVVVTFSIGIIFFVALITVFMGIYYIVVAVKVYKLVKRLRKKAARLRLVTIIIIIASGFIVLSYIVDILVIIFLDDAWSYKIGVFFWALFNMAVSFVEIIAFIPTRKSGSSSSSKRQGTSTNKEVATDGSSNFSS